MTTSKRRDFLIASLTGVVSVTHARTRIPKAQLTPEELAQIEDEAEPWPDSIEKPPERATRAELLPYYWSPEETANRKQPQWAQDSKSYDYAHLEWLRYSTRQFELRATTLSRYLELCSFEIDPTRTKVLFGVRGCQLAAKADFAGFAASIAVQEAIPDHVNFRCLMGVLDRATERISLFTASTVPEVTHMDAMIKGKSASNMQPTGRHEYRVGPHKGIKQPGAFRQQRDLLVRRSKRALLFSPVEKGNVWDDLDGALPYNNIHAAAFDPDKTRPPFFSSAGCQVVKGWYVQDNVPAGPWAEFRVAAGLDRRPNVSVGGSTPEDGRPFDYILATGRELRALGLSPDSEPKVRTLRLGSSGSKVTELQGALKKAGVKPSKQWKQGDFDRSTMEAVILWQRAHKPATGIVSTDDAAKLGLSW